MYCLVYSMIYIKERQIKGTVRLLNSAELCKVRAWRRAQTLYTGHRYSSEIISYVGGFTSVSP
jgi:hypothetical protein